MVIEDEKRRKAIDWTPGHELDVVILALERYDWVLRQENDHGLVIVARPSGDRRDEDSFIGECSDALRVGTDYVRFDRIATSVLTAPFASSRILQLADLVVSCTTALVAGHTRYTEPIFPQIKKMLRKSSGRVGGVGLNLHPDFCFVNLYHWIVGDDTFLRFNNGWPLPMSGRPYHEDPFIA